MIQFNLLPDVKLQYIKTRRLKRVLIICAFFAVALGILGIILTFSMVTIQKKHINNLDSDISRVEGELNEIEDLSRILTVQNQLNTLPGLYQGRPAAERLSGFINQMTPAEVGISRLSLDFSTSTIDVVGTGSSLETVNKYVDTIKFTNFTVVDPNTKETTTEKAFSNVVLTSFSKEEKGRAGFTITMQFNPSVFDDAKDVKLVVPSLTTTRSQLQQGEKLFVDDAEGAE